MRFYRNVSAICLVLICAGGCASNGGASSSATHPPCEQCMVCKHNADLACVDVVVDANTPRYEYQGKTYYFCSETCREAFAKNPEKYAQ
jgi:YHS domain-containing protein